VCLSVCLLSVCLSVCLSICLEFDDFPLLFFTPEKHTEFSPCFLSLPSPLPGAPTPGPDALSLRRRLGRLQPPLCSCGFHPLPFPILLRDGGQHPSHPRFGKLQGLMSFPPSLPPSLPPSFPPSFPLGPISSHISLSLSRPLQLLVERSFGNYLKAYSLGEEQEVDIANRGLFLGRIGGERGVRLVRCV